MIDASTRRMVRQRARERCEYCRLPQSSAPFTAFHIEHVIALQHGGTDDQSNLCLSCPDCNRHKGTNLTGIDSQTGSVVRLFDPRRDDWDENFTVIHAEIVGVSASGRATSRLLRFNSHKRLAVRDELAARGEFP